MRDHVSGIGTVTGPDANLPYRTRRDHKSPEPVLCLSEFQENLPFAPAGQRHRCVTVRMLSRGCPSHGSVLKRTSGICSCAMYNINITGVLYVHCVEMKRKVCRGPSIGNLLQSSLPLGLQSQLASIKLVRTPKKSKQKSNARLMIHRYAHRFRYKLCTR